MKSEVHKRPNIYTPRLTEDSEDRNDGIHNLNSRSIIGDKNSVRSAIYVIFLIP